MTERISGRKWASEMDTFSDPKTGREIIQLTRQWNNFHLYFTDNAFNEDGRHILLLSDRASGEDRDSFENINWQLYLMDLASGEMTQLTDEPAGVLRNGQTKTRDGSMIAYITGKLLRVIDMQTGSIRTIHEFEPGFNPNALSISPNKRYVGFVRNEDVQARDVGANYSGFHERYQTIKDGRVTLVRTDGSGAFDAFKDTCQLGHFQFSPVDSTIASFCHEGPWNLVTQRMWLMDLVSGEVKPCFRQGPKDAVGHEFFSADGRIFFDNRGPGHDGTITSSRTQAVATEVGIHDHDPDFKPFVGIADQDGNILKTLPMPYYCNHYHSNPDASVLVGDEVDDLVLIDISGEEARLETLCHHGTSWVSHPSHCHPTFDWQGKQILYASDKRGRVDLYLARL